MTHSNAIQAYLRDRQGLAECDDCVSKRLNIEPRQTVYMNAQRLLAMGLIVREKLACHRCGKVKLTSAYLSKPSNETRSSKRPSMINKKARETVKNKYGKKSLSAIGFEKAGLWALDGEQLSLHLIKHADLRPALYAFISKDEILYVGKTSRKLKMRLYHYSRPGPTQKTNIRLNHLLKEFLSNGSVAEIYAFGNQEVSHVGDFLIDVPASLEDDIIRKTSPRWNRR